MTEPIIPIIRIPVDPARVHRLHETNPSLRVGGVRVKTTIYVVTEADIPGARQDVTIVTVPAHAKVELRVVE